MNMYVPQTTECLGEMEFLMNARQHLIKGGQGVVQDTALGVFLMTDQPCPLGKNLFFKCLAFIMAEWDHNPSLKQHFDYEEVIQGPFTGRTLVSCLIGPKVHAPGLVEHGRVVGSLNKRTVKGKVLTAMFREYGSEEAAIFLFLLSRISCEFLRRRGFSVGISALEPWKRDTGRIELSQSVKDFVNETQTKDEWLLLRLGNLYKSMKSVRAKELFATDNPMIVLGKEKSGAKGSLLNLIQIRASLAQQYYKGGLIRPFRGHRVLSSEPLNPSKHIEQALTSRGFINSNFLSGLSPTEFALHAMTSRLSLLDTALKTSESGYASRRLGKSMEDCKIEYDGTMRNKDKVLFFDVDHFDDDELVPGHPVGVIAAQSIGQRIMQLTLNTFHQAGTACLEVSQGVPRMEALINCWRKKLQVTQTMSIARVPAWVGHQFLRAHDTVCVKDLMFCKAKVVRLKSAPPTCSMYGMKLLLDEVVCAKKRICPWDIERSIRENPLLYPCLIPVARPKALTLFFQSALAPADAKRALLLDWLPKVKKHRVRGEGLQASWSGETLHIQGAKLGEAIGKFHQFWDRLSSSNTIEVWKVLGVEAARIVLRNELNKVFSNGVDRSYILTLCEYMLWHGSFTPITRTGIKRSDKNVWKSMGFERTLRTAAQAATENASATFEGMSERVIINDEVAHGTGCCATIKTVRCLAPIVVENLNPQVVVEEGQDDEDEIYGKAPMSPVYDPF